MARWRPVCPECGYSLRRLVAPRCPECGVDLPTSNRFFRRWAVQRIPWDRARRGNVVTAYLGTLLRIFLTPWRAGRSVAIPDRWGRAIWWAVAHLLLCAVAAACMVNQQYYPRWLVEQIHPSPFQHPALWFADVAPTRRVMLWLMQSLFAWTVVLLSFPLAGAMVSVGALGRHRAAKFSGVKWSLYVLPVLLPLLGGWHLRYFLWERQLLATSLPTAPPSPLQPWVFACVYGIWWSVGTAANPYDRRRRVPPLIVLTLLYACVWFSLARLLFPGGDLGVLL